MNLTLSSFDSCFVPNRVLKSKYPRVPTLSPVNPTICSLNGAITSSDNSICWKVVQYNILTELPWSTRTLPTSYNALWVVMTIGSSYSRFGARKSSSVNVMFVMDMGQRFIAQTFLKLLKCLLRAEDEIPPRQRHRRWCWFGLWWFFLVPYPGVDCGNDPFFSRFFLQTVQGFFELFLVHGSIWVCFLDLFPPLQTIGGGMPG